MRGVVVIIFVFFISQSLLAKESLVAIFEDNLKTSKISLPIIPNQVVMMKPDIYLALKGSTNIEVKTTPALSVKTEDNLAVIKIPNATNATYQFTVNTKKTSFNFIVLTGFKDENTDDDIVEYDSKKHQIGFYGKIPSTPGKINYFKDHYKPPEWFFLWDTNLEQKSISKYILYKDLVVIADPKPTDKEPPSRHTDVFTFSYEAILNFEMIVDRAKKTVNFERPFILSFYRTPNYNRKIGSSAFSRHVYGDAIDWYVDENPYDLVMDDLNKNKKVDVYDAKCFMDAFIYKVTEKKIPPGGMGTYFTKKGASMHYDCRGHLAKWGEFDIYWPNTKLPPWLKEVEDKIKELSQKK